MKEYEISNNDKVLGTINLFENNINNNIKNSIINYNNKSKYKILKDIYLQTYKITININNIDELYNIVSKYKQDNISETIEKIKEYNKLKTIKPNTILNLILTKNEVELLGIDINNINLDSLLNSKIYFIKNVLENNNINNIEIELNNIINTYNNIKNSNEYEFLTDEELENKLKSLISQTNNLINIIENNTSYKYEKDFIIPIKIS